MTETVGLIIGFLLTLFIYSYIVGDNPLYRIAIHLLIGISAAYAIVIAMREVITPLVAQLRANPTGTDTLLWIIPLLLGVLLLLRLAPAAAPLGNGALAALIGIGAAVALVGSIAGTLWPQLLASAGGSAGPENHRFLGAISGLLTICTLLYFQYTHRFDMPDAPEPTGRLAPLLSRQKPLIVVGQVVITITLAAVYANVLSTGLVLLAERITFFVEAVSRLVGGFLS